MNVKAMFLVAGVAMVMGLNVTADQLMAVKKQYRPKLFKQFGAIANVPDGLAQDKAGNIYCAAPNFVNPSYAGTIMKMDKATGEWTVFVAGLLHPETQRGAPMGMEFAEDGSMYYCDNQYFSNKNYKSRIIRVVIDKNGEPLGMETVVENIKLANAMRVRGNAIYFTDTFFDIEGKNQGGVYCVPISAFKEHPVRLLPKEQAANDPYCIGITSTTPLPNRKDIAATDGMCFDKDGNIYTGNFGDGHFYVIRIKNDGKYGKPETLVKDPQALPCVDGVCYDAKRNRVYIADSERNAILYWDIKSAKLNMMWMNDDKDGADGLLDQPCEPMVWGDKLIVVNFDMTFPGLKNKVNDPFHTISVIDLEAPPFWHFW